MGEATMSDGVRLKYWESGAGPLVILVHGSATDHRCFDLVVDHLSGFRTVSYDRRGYGASGDGSEYSLDRDVQDLVEVIEQVSRSDGRASVVGYSYGGLITLTAISTRSAPIATAVLYEPPVGDVAPEADRVEGLLAAGTFDEALGVFVSTTFGLSDGVVAAMRRSSMWDVSVGVVTNLAREMPFFRAAKVPTGPLESPPLRVLVAERGGNPEFLRIATEIESNFVRCDVQAVAGLPHFAMATEPASFAAACLTHLRLHSEQAPILEAIV